MEAGRPTRALIDLAALRANFALAGRLAAGRSVIAVIKADAYGHGAVPVARTLAEAGCKRLAVVTTEEAAQLRQAGLALPILLLGGVHDEAEAAFAAAKHLTPVVQHAAQVALLEAAMAGRQRAGSEVAPLPVHVEIDTGMARMGAAPEDAPALLARVATSPALSLSGCFTHFARADEADLAPTRAQLQRWSEVLAAASVEPGLLHAANSAGLLAAEALGEVGPPTGAVRPGLMLYGVSPASHFRADLRPVMSLRTRVAQVRRLREGDAVGYGASWRAKAPTTIATLPLGYADGVLRSSGNRGHVLLGEQRLPIVGRISMDYTTVDAGALPVAIGDEVVVFGQGDEACLPVEEAAEAAGTIGYELLTAVAARVPRVVVG